MRTRVSSQGLGQAWSCPVAGCRAEIRSPDDAVRHAEEEARDGRPGHIAVFLAVVTDPGGDG